MATAIFTSLESRSKCTNIFFSSKASSKVFFFISRLSFGSFGRQDTNSLRQRMLLLLLLLLWLRIGVHDAGPQLV